MYHKLMNKLMTKTGLFFIVFAIQIVTVPLFHIPTITDALNPLALGFMARGEDWSQYLIADGYYYKYGQLLFYFPLIYLIRNNVVLYRTMLLVNALIVSLIPVCAYEILTKHLKSKGTQLNYYISLLTATIPVISLNSKYTWAEPILMVLPWIVLLLLLKSMEGDSSKKRRCFYSISLAVVQVYAYMVHTRGMVILAATLICVCLIRIVFQNRNIFISLYFAATLTLLIFDRKVGMICKGVLYSGTEDLTGGTLSFLSGEFLNHLFSLGGLKVWGEEILGWLFASVISTFGLTSFGLAAAILVLFRFKEWHIHSKQELVIIIFSVLCFFGALLLGTVFFFDELFAVNTIEIAQRGDKVIYARYLNGASVCVSFIGLYYFMLKDSFWKTARLFYVFSILIILHSFFISTIAKRVNGTITWSTNMMTINYFCDLKQCIRGGLYSAVGFLSGGVAAFSLFVILFFLLAIINRKKKEILFVSYLVAFLAGYIWNSYNAIYRADCYMMKPIEAYSGLIKSVQGEEKLANMYLDDEILRCGFQYFFSDYYVLTKRDDNRYNIQNMFIISSSEIYNGDLFENDYFEVLNLDDDAAEYHIYIKGRELNEKIQESGYVTRQIIEIDSSREDSKCQKSFPIHI